MAQATTDLPRRTPHQVFMHHWEALMANDLDAMLQDYAEAACIITPDAVTRGKEGVRTFFARALQTLPDAQWTHKATFADNILLLEWTADSASGSVSDGVDTVVFRDGLIHYQTVRFTLVPKP
jgi:ketosteroid isomerase-like protein